MFYRGIVCVAVLLFSMAFCSCKKVEQVSQQDQQVVEQQQSQLADPVYSRETAAQVAVTDPTEKLFVNMIIAASNSLRTLNGRGSGVEYEAVFTVAPKDKVSFLENCLMIFPKESPDSSQEEEAKESCRACGLVEGSDCVKKVIAKLRASDDGKLEVWVRMDGDCVVVEY